MAVLAAAFPILPGKAGESREFSLDLHEGPNHKAYAALVKRTGLKRVRAWIQAGPDGGGLMMVLYQGKAPQAFLQELATSQDPFVVWFRKRIMEIHGADMTQPMGPPAELVTDLQVG